MLRGRKFASSQSKILLSSLVIVENKNNNWPKIDPWSHHAMLRRSRNHGLDMNRIATRRTGSF